MDIQFKNLNKSKKNLVLEFDVSNIKTSMLNALRRVMLGEIYNVGFHHGDEFNKGTIKIIENTTGLHNEFISHRISMLPLKIESFSKKIIKFLHEYKDLSESKNELSEYLFKIDVSQESNLWITTDDFKVYKNGELLEKSNEYFTIDPFSNNPTIVSRFPNKVMNNTPEKLIIECYPTMMTANESVGFSYLAMSVLYSLDEKKNETHMKIETIGSMETEKIVMYGLKTLRFKINDLLTEITDIKDENKDTDYGGNSHRIRLETSNNEHFRGIDVIFDGESHTLGNMLQEWIYDHELNKSLTSISYFEPHPLKKQIVLRFVLNEKSDDINIHMNKTIELLENHLTLIHDVLLNMENNWMSIVNKNSKK